MSSQDIALAENLNTPVEVLFKLANSGTVSVRSQVAFNPNTPVEALNQLANDEEWIVRARVAENSNTPSDVLVALAEDEDSFVRREVVGNISSPIDVLVALSSENWLMRKWAINNPGFVSFMKDYKTENGLLDIPDSWVLKTMGVQAGQG